MKNLSQKDVLIKMYSVHFHIHTYVTKSCIDTYPYTLI